MTEKSKNKKTLSSDHYSLIRGLIQEEIKRVGTISEIASKFLTYTESKRDFNNNTDFYIGNLNSCLEELEFTYHNSDFEKKKIIELLKAVENKIK